MTPKNRSDCNRRLGNGHKTPAWNSTTSSTDSSLQVKCFFKKKRNLEASCHMEIQAELLSCYLFLWQRVCTLDFPQGESRPGAIHHFRSRSAWRVRACARWACILRTPEVTSKQIFWAGLVRPLRLRQTTCRWLSLGRRVVLQWKFPKHVRKARLEAADTVFREPSPFLRPWAASPSPSFLGYFEKGEECLVIHVGEEGRARAEKIPWKNLASEFVEGLLILWFW